MAGVHRGEGQTLFVSGDEGLGGHDSASVLDERASRAGLSVGVGVAARVAGEWPYAPVLEALSELCRRDPSLLEGLTPAMRAEIGDALAGHRTSWDGQGSHQRLFVAAAELLRLAASDRGVIIVVDQAEEADEATLRLLHYLSRNTLGARALIALGHRPVEGGGLAELRANLSSRGRAVMLDLAPLGRDEAVRLASTLAPDANGSVLEAIFQKSGGVPFIVVELAECLESGPGRRRPHCSVDLGTLVGGDQSLGPGCRAWWVVRH